MGLLSNLFGTPTDEQFALLVSEALRADGVQEPISFETATYSLRIGDDHVLHLGNFYAEFLRVSRGERDAYVRSLVRKYRSSSEEAPKNFREARHRLLPHLRSRCYFTFSNLAGSANGLEVNFRPFRLLTDAIAIGLVLDFPETMRAVDHAMLASWEVGEAEALEIAVANLRARTDPQFEEHEAGVWVSTWQDSYDATRLLLPDLIASLPVRGRHVALVPHRNLLIVTGDMDAPGLGAMAELASEAFNEPQAISVTPLVRSEDSWTELLLDDAHPAANAFALVRLQMAASEYEEQKELLEAVAARSGDDTFFATFIASRHQETGALSSTSTWSEGVKQIIPRADLIAFAADGNGEPTSLGFVKWDDAVRIMGPSITPTGDYPPRYAVKGFPTEAQLREMGIE